MQNGRHKPRSSGHFAIDWLLASIQYPNETRIEQVNIGVDKLMDPREPVVHKHLLQDLELPIPAKHHHSGLEFQRFQATFNQTCEKYVKACFQVRPCTGGANVASSLLPD